MPGSKALSTTSIKHHLSVVLERELSTSTALLLRFLRYLLTLKAMLFYPWICNCLIVNPYFLTGFAQFSACFFMELTCIVFS